MKIDTHELDEELDEDKPMKIQLSMRHHLMLHSLKILTGRTIAEIVDEALERYYDAEGIEDGTEGA